MKREILHIRLLRIMRSCSTFEQLLVAYEFAEKVWIKRIKKFHSIAIIFERYYLDEIRIEFRRLERNLLTKSSERGLIWQKENRREKLES